MTALAVDDDLPAGVERRPRRGGDEFRTRWRDPITKRKLSAQYPTVEEVVDFRARLHVARARGEVAALARGDRTITSYVDGEWWPKHVLRRLENSTRDSYRSVWRRHIKPHLGDLQLRQLDAPGVDRYQDMLYDLEVGEPTIARAMWLLQGICQEAIIDGEIKFNPVREIKKPRPEARLMIAAPSAEQVEAVRAELDPEGAALVSLIGYIGLRPSEALALAVRHLGRSTVLVERRLIDGRLVAGQKITRGRQRPSRSPTLYDVVRQDLAEHLSVRPRQSPNALVFLGANGKPWTLYDYRRWREQIFGPAVKRAGVELARPYDLRHGSASMRLHAGLPLTDIAAQMGHTVATLSSYYAHEIADLRGQIPVSVEDQIAQARLTKGDAMREIP